MVRTQGHFWAGQRPPRGHRSLCPDAQGLSLGLISRHRAARGTQWTGRQRYFQRLKDDLSWCVWLEITNLLLNPRRPTAERLTFTFHSGRCAVRGALEEVPLPSALLQFHFSPKQTCPRGSLKCKGFSHLFLGSATLWQSRTESVSTFPKPKRKSAPFSLSLTRVPTG